MPSRGRVPMEHLKRGEGLQQLMHNNGGFDGSFPLRGVVLCCTSIPTEQRTELTSQAEEMGAQHRFDLTSEVTHLIVGAYDTPKYRYVAKERPDVKVLKSTWIGAVRQLWIEDTNIDLPALEKEHTLPTFASLKICVTGFEDLERKEIIDLVSANGADYSGDLTKQISHLIAYRPEGAKYMHAKSWGIQIISIEWLHESIARGMILDESLYSLDLPQEERGKGAWKRHPSSKSPLGKRKRDDVAGSLEEGKRRLRRTASTKLNSQNENIWGDIVGGDSMVQAATSEQRELSDDRGREWRPASGLTEAEPTQLITDIPRTLPDLGKRGVFGACRFYIHGFHSNQDRLLRQVLISHDAEICTNQDDLVAMPSLRSYIVVPHLIPHNNVVTALSPSVQPVTEFWIERCIEAKSLVDLDDYPLGKPFPFFPIQEFRGLKVCSTGFSGLELLHLSKTVALLGATYEDYFTNAATVLICNSNRPIRVEKLDLAKAWKVPVVSVTWFIDCINHGVKQSFQPYLSRAKISANTALACERSVSQPAFHKPTTNLSGSSEDHRAGKGSRPPETSHMDTTAFEDDDTVKIKHEECPTNLSKSSFTIIAEPLKEISPNSPTKASLSPTRPQARASNSVPQEDLNTAITSILARSKTTASNQDQSEQTDSADSMRRKRTTSRILGRAASNVSSASATMSRASSVDSTASTGQAVLWPNRPRNNLPEDQRRSGHLDDQSLTNSNDNGDSQFPQTQRLQYEDTESNAYKEQIVARMTGSKVQKREKEKVLTVASLDMSEGPKPRRLRQRAEPGFR